MDESQKMALNENEEANADTTPVSEATEEVKETESTEEVQPEAETGEKSKKGFSNRVRELNARAKQAEEKARQAEEQIKSLSERVEELTGGSPDVPQYTPPIQPGAEITPEQYGNDVARRADAIVNLRLKQQSASLKIQSDTQAVVQKYPELDPDNDLFDKDLSQSVTEAVEAKVRANPYSADVKGFVDKLMKPYKRSVAKEVGKVGEELAKQASQTAVKPTSVRKPTKSAEEKSIQELERELGIVQT